MVPSVPVATPSLSDSIWTVEAGRMVAGGWLGSVHSPWSRFAVVRVSVCGVRLCRRMRVERAGMAVSRSLQGHEDGDQADPAGAGRERLAEHGTEGACRVVRLHGAAGRRGRRQEVA